MPTAPLHVYPKNLVAQAHVAFLVPLHTGRAARGAGATYRRQTAAAFPVYRAAALGDRSCLDRVHRGPVPGATLGHALRALRHARNSALGATQGEYRYWL